MKKYIAVFSLAAAFATSLFAGEIEWDFSMGTKPSGGLFEFKLAKDTVLKDGALYINGKKLGKTSPGSFAAKQKYADLTPKGAFKLSFVFTLEKARSFEYYIMLWDNKGDYYERGTGKPLDNSGMTVALLRPKNAKTFQPSAWFGFGTKTAEIRGKNVPVVIGKKYTLELEYDGVSKYIFRVDGKVNGSGVVKHGGALAPAMRKLAIGNRCVGNYFPFDGKIHSVKLVTKEAAK